jgi:hypothetical protein
LSTTATPVRPAVFAAGFEIVMVRLAVPFSRIVGAPKAFETAGGAVTITEAEAVPPVPPSVDVTLPVVLFFAPAEAPVTLTEKLQLPEAARVAVARLTTFVPATAVIVPAPQVPVSPFGVDTTSPAGSVSVKATPLRVVDVLLFCTVKLSDVEPLRGIPAAPKALTRAGGATTVIDAFEVLPVPLSVAVT